MREFLEREIDIVSLKTLLRVWAAKATFDREIFLPGGYETTEEELSEMVRLEKPALMARLSEYSFYPEIAGDLERVETTGVGALLRKVEKIHLTEAARYSHLHALSILPILDYILRKDREAQNIRLIARGKESRLSTDVIRELLVVLHGDRGVGPGRLRSRFQAGRRATRHHELAGGHREEDRGGPRRPRGGHLGLGYRGHEGPEQLDATPARDGRAAGRDRGRRGGGRRPADEGEASDRRGPVQVRWANVAASGKVTTDIKGSGTIQRVAGPVVTAIGLKPRMYDVVLVGTEQLMGEVIQILGEKTVVQ